MDIKSINIFKHIFNNINDSSRFSKDKILLAIHKFKEQSRNKEETINERKKDFFENYEIKRETQNYDYDLFLKAKHQLWKEYEHSQSKDSLYKLLHMNFDYKSIPELYTYNIPKSKLGTREKQISDGILPEDKKSNVVVPSTNVKKKICPPGKVLNPVTNRCVQDKNKKPEQTNKPKENEPKKKECPPGKVLNPVTNRCVQDKNKKPTQ